MSEQAFGFVGIEEATAHLKSVDPILGSRIVGLSINDTLSRKNSYESLVRIVIGQQLSAAAARTIFQRVKRSIGYSTITPKRLAMLSDDALLKAGISRAKLRTIRVLAEGIEHKEIRLRQFRDMDEMTISSTLTKIKGIGPWTVQMYLMFGLQRSDIFPDTDAGILRAIRLLYDVDQPKKIESITEKWRPYRTVACWYLWKYLDT